MRHDNNIFQAAFEALRAGVPQVDNEVMIEMNGQMFWQLAHFWFMSGAATFQAEVVNEDALRGPLSLLSALAAAEKDLDEAAAAMTRDIMPGTRH
jgi:hypothetical protein